jgi:hypothetical protein
MGTTIMSWKIRMAKAFLPCAVEISFRSCNTFKTMAVLESEKRKPTKTDSL